MTAKDFKFVENIVEDDRWKKYYDPSERAMEWVWDASWEEFRIMSVDDCSDLVYDLAKKTLTKKEYAEFTKEASDALCRAMKEGRDSFETISRAIMDSMGYAYEIAAGPDDSDIDRAMEYAYDEFLHRFIHESWAGLMEIQVPKGVIEWAPEIKPPWTEDKIAKDLASKIKYVHESNKWDRFIVFEFNKAASIRDLLAFARTLHPDDRQEVLDDIHNDLVEAVGSFMGDFFKALHKRMENLDISYRVDFHKQWRAMLEEKSLYAPVRDEITNFMKTYTAEVES